MNSQNHSTEWSEALRECLNHESLLLADLRRLLDQPTTEQTRSALLRVCDALLASLPSHLELACQGGYLDEVHRLRPNWHHQIDTLHGANIWCIAVLRELREQIASEAPSGTIEVKESGEFSIWAQSLENVREHESRILQRAFTIDIGGEA